MVRIDLSVQNAAALTIRYITPNSDPTGGCLIPVIDMACIGLSVQSGTTLAVRYTAPNDDHAGRPSTYQLTDCIFELCTFYNLYLHQLLLYSYLGASDNTIRNLCAFSSLNT